MLLLCCFCSTLKLFRIKHSRQEKEGMWKTVNYVYYSPTCLKPPTVCMPFISSVCVHTHYNVCHYNPKPTCAGINWEQLESQKTYVRHDGLQSERGFLLDTHVQTLHRVTVYTQTHDQVFSSTKWWLVVSVILVTYQNRCLFFP